MERARTVAKLQFSRAATSLETGIEAKNLSVTVERRYNELREAWKDVQKKHDEYVSSTQESEETSLWIDELCKRFCDLEIAADNYLLECSNKTEREQEEEKLRKLEEERRQIRTFDEAQRLESVKVKITECRNRRNQEGAKLTTHIENMESLLAETDSEKLAHVAAALEENRRQLENSINGCQQAHIKLLSLVENTDDEEEKWIYPLWKSYNEISSKVTIFCSKHKPKATSIINPNPTPKIALKNSGIQLEKLRFSVFEGNLRRYPKFKSDFQNYIQPMCNTGQVAFVLKSYLSPNIQEEVETISDNLDDMWKRLDKRYGDESKLIDSIMADIKGLKPTGEESSTLNMIHTIDKAYKDLDRMGLQHEINNSTIVSLIEEKMPQEMWKEWVKTITNERENHTSKFTALYKLLLEWRDRLEYSLADIRCPINPQQGRVNYGQDTRYSKPVMKCWIHTDNGGEHPIWRCRIFKAKTPAERLEMVKANKACLLCLDTTHETSNCERGFKCRVPSCNLPHHALLHDAYTLGLSFHMKASIEAQDVTKTILQLQAIDGGNKDGRRETINTLWDAGSTLSFITFQKAKQLKLKGRRIKLEITKIGGQTDILDSQQYELFLTDERHKIVSLQVLGIENISSQINEVKMEGVAHIFKDTIKNIQRPKEGYIDCLIGYQYAGFHPVPVKSNNHLLLLKNRFGYIIAGSHPLLIEKTQKTIRSAQIHLATGEVRDFYELENLGINCQPKCGSCSCGKCHLGGKNMTLREEKEYIMIKDNLKYLTDKKRWQVKLPCIKDLRELPYNRTIALATLYSTERKLTINPEHASLYQRQIDDMIARGVAREIRDSELANYQGPIYFISHFAIMKPESKTTPCRIVFHSSQKFHGTSLNEYYAKGPSMLNNMLGILLRFRENKVAFIGDISKMFHSIEISIEDQMTHLFLWRDMDSSRRPTTYAITRVNMGDRPSSAIAQTALQETAKMHQEEYPIASMTIISNSYMDDIPDSVETMDEATSIMEDIDVILETGSFKIKEWVVSGQENKDKNATSSDQRVVKTLMKKELEEDKAEKVLGMKWDTLYEKILFTTNKIKENIPNNYDKPERNLSRRQILSCINGLYDPCGLLSPFIVRAKILLRKLWAKELKLDWDDPIPNAYQNEWKVFFGELRTVNDLVFHRSMKPDNAIGNPSLIIFSDGSSEAYGAVAYVRWKTADDTYESRIVIAKNRVAPIKTIDIVRLELCGAVISKRLRVFLEKELRFNFDNVYHIVDSEIVQAMINKSSYGFNTFAANRLGEIHEATSPSEWYWVRSELNIADWISRGRSSLELNIESKWQKGPEFLSLPIEKWPISSRTIVVDLPDRLKTGVTAIAVAKQRETLADRINIQRFSKFQRLINTTALILKLYQRFKFNNDTETMELCANDINRAEKLWLQDAQRSIEPKRVAIVKLCPRYKDDLLVVGGRTERWMAATWNKQEFILLPYEHRISQLIAVKEHQQIGHLGTSATISKIRSRFWIIKVRKLVKDIIFKCVICKKKFERLSMQIMSPLPIERMQPCPPFSSVGIDFFGPYSIRGEVQKRTKGKGYGVIIACSSSRAVYVDISKDYSTDSLLQVIRRFASIRGWPSKIFSDNGTQLVAASKELSNAIKGIDVETLKRYSVTKGTDWTFPPPNAPWHNGATEALVKSVKRALNTVIGDQILTFSELQTVMFEVAQIVNQRPIGQHPSNPEDGAYLCPNDLILGRASPNVPQGPFLERTSDRYRFDFLQSIVDAYWKRWLRDVFPSLVIRPKWHVKRRNVRKGDVVLIQDVNALRGEWKKGIVTEVYPDADNVVRRVLVSYKNIKGNNHDSPKFISVERAIQKLIVLVAVEDE